MSVLCELSEKVCMIKNVVVFTRLDIMSASCGRSLDGTHPCREGSPSDMQLSVVIGRYC